MKTAHVLVWWRTAFGAVCGVRFPPTARPYEAAGAKRREQHHQQHFDFHRRLRQRQYHHQQQNKQKHSISDSSSMHSTADIAAWALLK